MNFIIYENAEPVLTEYCAPEALSILLNRHDEFPLELIECVSAAAELELSCDGPQFIYSIYVSSVVQLRAHLLSTTLSFK